MYVLARPDIAQGGTVRSKESERLFRDLSIAALVSLRRLRESSNTPAMRKMKIFPSGEVSREDEAKRLNHIPSTS